MPTAPRPRRLRNRRLPIRRVRVGTASLSLALAVAACAAPGAGDGVADVPLVAATPWPLAWLVEAIAPGAEVRDLGPTGQDPHDLDLAPGAQELLQRADVVVHLGEVGFQPQVERAVARREGPVVGLAEVAASLALPAAHDHDEEAPGSDEAVDPHLWFDARTLAAAAPAVAEALAAVDPADAAGYRARAAATAAGLRGLHRQVAALFTGCRVRTAVVSHAAFAYLLAPHDLEQLSVSEGAGHAEASPARLAELAKAIRAQRLTAVLAEPVEGRAAAATLAREAGVAVRDVDPLESPAPADRAAGYPALLLRQAETFADVLECGA
jgi:zinc transport system substrate-binding protein